MFDKGISIRSKVAINTLIAVCASIAFSIVMDHEIKNQSSTILSYHDNDLKTAQRLQRIRTSFVEIRELMRLTVQDEDDLYLEDTVPLVFSVKGEFVLLKGVNEISDIVIVVEEKFDAYVNRAKITLNTFVENGLSDQSTIEFTLLNDLLHSYLKAFDRLEEKSEAMYKNHQSHYKEQQAQLNRYSVFMLLGLLVILSTSSYFLVRTLTLSLLFAQGAANEIAKGNLKSAINTERTDEVGLLLNAIDQMRLELLIVQNQTDANAAILESLNMVILEGTYLSVAKAFRQVANAIGVAIYYYDSDDFVLLGMNSIDEKNYTLEKLCSPGVLTAIKGERESIIVAPDSFGLASEVELGFSSLAVHSITLWPMWFSEQQVGALLMAHPTALAEAQREVVEHGLSQLAITVHGAQVEHERERLMENLAKKTDQLEIKSQEAEQASAAKSEFIGNMSHELRTPLNSILGFTGMLKKNAKEKLNEREQDALNLINDSSINLLDLINGLLDFSQMESSNLVLSRRWFDVVELIHECVEQQKPDATKKQLMMHFLPETEDLKINADRGRVRMIIINLLSNAIKFTEKGSVTVKVHWVQWQDRDSVCLEVEDTGIGIRETDQKELFERFSQLDGSISRAAEGMGLGLPMTKKLVDLHGGELRCESRFGEGSIFTVYLPLEPFKV
ncbi:MAG: hypothetical protein COB51_13525 [Moraxellaceae bacterium]|nr:MAG: hypothetical protein COB51_13525 [Moraxellaceae bacterium]